MAFKDVPRAQIKHQGENWPLTVYTFLFLSLSPIFRNLPSLNSSYLIPSYYLLAVSYLQCSMHTHTHTHNCPSFLFLCHLPQISFPQCSRQSAGEKELTSLTQVMNKHKSQKQWREEIFERRGICLIPFTIPRSPIRHQKNRDWLQNMAAYLWKSSNPQVTNHTKSVWDIWTSKILQC